MPAGLFTAAVVAPERSPLQRRRKLAQRRRGGRVPRPGPQRPLPQREHRLALRHARSPGHGAQGARVERGVPLLEPLGTPVRGEEVGERGGREGRERQREETGESFRRGGCSGVRGRRRVVREVGLQAAGEGKGAQGEGGVGEKEERVGW